MGSVSARVSTDLPESRHTEVDAGGQTKAKTTIGLDGNSYPRGWKKRPEGQGQQKKPRSPRSENHAKGLVKLLEKSLHPAANALETLIPDSWTRASRPRLHEVWRIASSMTLPSSRGFIDS